MFSRVLCLCREYFHLRTLFLKLNYPKQVTDEACFKAKRLQFNPSAPVPGDADSEAISLLFTTNGTKLTPIIQNHKTVVNQKHTVDP